MRATESIDAAGYHRDVVPGLLVGENGMLAAEGLAGLAPLTLVVGDGAWTYAAEGGRLKVAQARLVGGLRVVMSPATWTDFVSQMRTAAAIAIAGDVEVEGGTVLDLFAWEPVLRALYFGTPIYQPNPLTFPDGTPVDLDHPWTLDHADADLAAFFATTGVMRVRGVFTPDEVAAMNAEIDRLAAEARVGDDRSWWAATEGGEDRLCRLVYMSEKSELFAALPADPRLLRLSSLLQQGLVATVDRMEGVACLIKPAGAPKGLANIPWHTDCGLGGHHIMCPSVALGIQLTGSTPETGCLEAIAGTHGKTCPPPETGTGGLPYMLIPTEPGDVTVHVSDVLHASPPPTGQGGRRTTYITYHPPVLADWIEPGQAMNDLIRSRSADQLDAGLGK